MFQVVGRLKPGVTAASAEAELDTVARQLEQAYGEDGKSQKGRRVFLKDGAPLLLAVLALGACYVPARKSMRIDPAAALRQDG